MEEWIPETIHADGSASGIVKPLGFVDGSESMYTSMSIIDGKYYMDHTWWNECSLERKLWELNHEYNGDEDGDGYITDSNHRDVCNIIGGGC